MDGNLSQFSAKPLAVSGRRRGVKGLNLGGMRQHKAHNRTLSATMPAATVHEGTLSPSRYTERKVSSTAVQCRQSLCSKHDTEHSNDYCILPDHCSDCSTTPLTHALCACAKSCSPTSVLHAALPLAESGETVLRLG